MWIALGGYKAAGDIDRFVKVRNDAITDRAKRGLPIISRVPMSHKVIRDQNTGNANCLQVNEDKRHLWDDLAELILEGVAWFSIEDELFNRYGHIRDNGERYYPGFLYRLIMKPIFWGHIARHHASAGSKNGFKYGAWAYDESVSMPEGATIFRNTHEPVWTGELVERIKAEIRRRSNSVRGNTNPKLTYRFSGLGVCAECGSFRATHVKKSKSYPWCDAICPASKARSSALPKCSNKRIMSEKRLIALMNDYLKQMLERMSLMHRTRSS